MQCNIGKIDRALRITAGVVLITLTVTHNLGLWGYIGIVPLLTGAIAWCPAYMPFGIKTCKAR